MDGLKRYDLNIGIPKEMFENDTGDYVKYSDILPLIETMKNISNHDSCFNCENCCVCGWGFSLIKNESREALKKAGIK